MKNFITTQSDFWDMIALRAYRDELGQFLMHKVIEANFWARKIAQFSGGITVAIPAREPIVEISLVPWKKVTVAAQPTAPKPEPAFLGSFETLYDLPPVPSTKAQPGDFAYVKRGASITRGNYIRYGGAVLQAKGER